MIWFSVASWLFIFCAGFIHSGFCQIQFVENAKQRGIDFMQFNGSKTKEYIVEAKGAGVAVADVNQDGWDDLYFVNGSVIDGTPPDLPPQNQLYLNNQDGTFRNATAESGLGDEGFGCGAWFVDVDNDGDLDCYITNYGPNQLYLNDGSCRFSKTPNANGAQNNGWSTGSAFADINNDGFLDVFVGQYAEFSKELAEKKGKLAPFHHIMAFIGPSAYEPAADNLFLNQGDGSFRDVTTERGMLPFAKGRAFTALWTDLDNDQDLDLYVANDTTANHLYENNGSGNFNEMALIAGTALSEDGTEQGGMGASSRDMDHDMDADLFVTNYQNERNILYANQSNMQFLDATLTSGFGMGSAASVGFGLITEDFDNDGWVDAAIFNGHVYPQADAVPSLAGYAQANQFLLNQQNGVFTDVTAQLHDIAQLKGVSRGAAAGDFDRDGDMDIAVNNLDGEPFYFENVSPARQWLQVDIRNQHNMPDYGTKVIVTAGTHRQMQELLSSASFLSQNSAVLHFGLGDWKGDCEIKVIRPNEKTETHSSIKPNQRMILKPVVSKK